MATLFDYLEQQERKPEPLSVGDLTLLLKGTLEATFADVWVVGEISNLSRPRSGHCYLALKDEAAQLPAVVWRSSASKIKFDLTDGLLVVCHGRIDVYPPHGKYQLVIDTMEPLGQGSLELAFRQLHVKLETEGLFAPGRKRPIPKHIRRVAVVTSPTGAAIRDFLQIMARRTRRIDVLLVPVRVQGDGASKEIADAIKMLNRLAPEQSKTSGSNAQAIDCIIVTRGGGSLEDLWAFNEEPLVRAVAESQIPVISAVGHETDVTLCDLAADLRALTPSEAAERIAPDDVEASGNLAAIQRFLDRGILQALHLARQRLVRFDEHATLSRPVETLIFPRQTMLDHLDERLQQGVKSQIERTAARLGYYAATLEALSPLAVLGRGYSMTFDRENHLLPCLAEQSQSSETGQEMVRRPRLSRGDEITTRFVDGTVKSTVNDILCD